MIIQIESTKASAVTTKNKSTTKNVNDVSDLWGKISSTNTKNSTITLNNIYCKF